MFFVTIIIRLFLQRYDIHCFRVNLKAQITLRTVCGGRVWLSLPFAIVVSEQGSEGDTRTYHQIRGRIISWLWHWSHFCLQLHAVVSWCLDGLDHCCVVENSDRCRVPFGFTAVLLTGVIQFTIYIYIY